MQRPSRRTLLITSVAAGVAAVLTVGAVIGLGVRADTDAKAAFDDATAALETARGAHTSATRELTIAQSSAAFAASTGSALVAIEPALLADATTLEPLSASIAALASTAGLVDVDGAWGAPEPQPGAAPLQRGEPTGREQLLERAAAMESEAKTIATETAELTASAAEVTTAIADVDAAAVAVAASAYAAGSAAVPPARASAESLAALTAAVAALEAPADDANLAALVLTYRDAWNAAVASDAATRSTSGAVSATYIKGILIVNKSYALPSTFGNGLTADTTAAFNAMQADAAAAGHNIYIASGFRSFSSQTTIYNRYKANEGQAGADTHSARPGHSEHQSGLAFDLNTITQAFGSTPEGIWTAQNAHLYGFIVRYPQGKESVTGYIWEPWHLRYVGVDVATTLYNSGQTLEEYLGVDSVYK